MKIISDNIVLEEGESCFSIKFRTGDPNFWVDWTMQVLSDPDMSSLKIQMKKFPNTPMNSHSDYEVSLGFSILFFYPEAGRPYGSVYPLPAYIRNNRHHLGVFLLEAFKFFPENARRSLEETNLAKNIFANKIFDLSRVRNRKHKAIEE